MVFKTKRARRLPLLSGCGDGFWKDVTCRAFILAARHRYRNKKTTRQARRGRITVSVGKMVRKSVSFWANGAPKRPSVALFISPVPGVTTVRTTRSSRSERSSILHLIATQDAASAKRAVMLEPHAGRVGQGGALLRAVPGKCTGTPQRPPSVQFQREHLL